MSALLGAITTKIGGFFMSVALFLGASAPVAPAPVPAEPAAVPVEIVEQVEVATDGDLSSSTDTPQKAISVTIPVIDAPKPKTSEESKDVPLSITDMNIDVNKRTATFTWGTTAEARSSLVINEETHDSVEGVSKSHTVSIKNLTKGAKYPYEIVAKTLGESPAEDKISRILQMPAAYTIELRPSKEGPNCFVFTVTNQEDDIVSGYSLVIFKGKTGQILMRENVTTNARGEINHCGTGDHFKLQGEDIAKVEGHEGVSISNYTAENLTEDDVKEYGTFSVSFNFLQNGS